MAFTPRKWQVVYQQILTEKANQPSLSGLSSTSQTAYWKLWAFIMAMSTVLLEQIMAIFFDEVETIISQGVPGTAAWIRAQVLKFQYGDTIQINEDFSISYPAEDTTKQIVTNCAVVVSAGGNITVKAAKEDPPVALDNSEKTALVAYLDSILPAGEAVQLISQDADELAIYADIYYDGQANNVISSDVITALLAYMSSFQGENFNGAIKVSDIEQTILAVQGVKDVVLIQVTGTPDGGTPQDIVLDKQVISREYVTVAGYVIEDGTNPFDDTLNFIVA